MTLRTGKSLTGYAMIVALGSCSVSANTAATETQGPLQNAATATATADAPAPTGAVVSSASVPRDFMVAGDFTQGGVARGTVSSDAVKLTLDGVNVPFDADGNFIIGFDRDVGQSASLVEHRRDGSNETKPITIAPYSWKIEHVNLNRSGGKSNPEYQAKRELELQMMGAARGVKTDAHGWNQNIIWPTTGRISGLFGSQRIYAGVPGKFHGGVDVARPTGAPLVAPADAVVTLVTPYPFSLEGNMLWLDHGNGLVSVFLHMSRIDVQQGDHVKQGQLVGAVGMTGSATGPHLHWAMRWYDAKIDPMRLAGPMGQ